MRKTTGLICLIFILLIVNNCGRAENSEIESIASLLNNERFSQAIVDLQKLISQHPHDPRLYYLLGFTFLKTKEHHQALENLDQALKKKQGYKEVIGDVDLANFLAGNSQSINDLRFKLAVRELEKIIKDNKGQVQAKAIGIHLAFWYLAKNEYLKAINQFQQVTTWSPPGEMEAEAYLEIGRIYLQKLEDFTKGEETLQGLANRFPNTNEAAEALLLLANSYKDRMEIYHKKYQVLNKFASDWKGKEQLAREIKEASMQAQQDLDLAGEFHKKASETVEILLNKYKNSSFSDQARLVKSDLERNLP